MKADVWAHSKGKNMKREVVVIALSLLCMPVFGQATREGIAVSGNSRIYFQPDLVEISFVVSTVHEDIVTAKAENEALLTKVLGFCRTQGVKENDLEQEMTRLGKSEGYNDKRFAANTAITVHLSDITKYAEFQIELVKLGVREIRSVTFMSSTMKELYDQAIMNAVKDARAKAELIAKQLDVQIGKPIWVQVQESLYTGEKKVYRYVKKDVLGGNPEDFKPTAIYVEAVVNATFGIK